MTPHYPISQHQFCIKPHTASCISVSIPWNTGGHFHIAPEPRGATLHFSDVEAVATSDARRGRIYSIAKEDGIMALYMSTHHSYSQEYLTAGPTCLLAPHNQLSLTYRNCPIPGSQMEVNTHEPSNGKIGAQIGCFVIEG